MSDSNNFLIIGHRGAAGEKFENSMSGFHHALSLDIDAIEFDVRLHNDELWVIHDHELDRLTEQTGLLEDAEDWSQIQLKNGEPIPKLKEVLDLCWGKIPMNIEIKSFDTALHLNQMLMEYPELPGNSKFPWVLISSFDHRQLLQLKHANCRFAISPVTYGIPANPEQLMDELEPFSWNFDDEYLDPNLISAIKSRGIRIMVYTVNDTGFARRLKAQGIDGIFTDLPSTMKHLG